MTATNISNFWSPSSLSANFPNLSCEPPTYICLWVSRTVRTSHVNKIIALFLHLYALVRLASGQTGCGHGDARTLLRSIKTTSSMPLKRVRGVRNESRLLQCRYGQYKRIDCPSLLRTQPQTKHRSGVRLQMHCPFSPKTCNSGKQCSIQRFRRSIISATPRNTVNLLRSSSGSRSEPGKKLSTIGVII